MKTKCEDGNCQKRHPKVCKFYKLYDICKFGQYCAFDHRDNPLKVEMNELKMKYSSLEYELNEKGNEVMELKKKVELLEDVVKEVVSRVEGITTPTKEGIKKRRRVRQTPTPSPAHRGEEHHEHAVEGGHGQGVDHQTDCESEKSDRSLTAEEIVQMYDSGKD